MASEIYWIWKHLKIHKVAKCMNRLRVFSLASAKLTVMSHDLAINIIIRHFIYAHENWFWIGFLGKICSFAWKCCGIPMYDIRKVITFAQNRNEIMQMFLVPKDINRLSFLQKKVRIENCEFHVLVSRTIDLCKMHTECRFSLKLKLVFLCLRLRLDSSSRKK